MFKLAKIYLTTVNRDQKNVRLVQPKYNVRCYNIDSIKATQERRNHMENYIWCAMIFK